MTDSVIKNGEIKEVGDKRFVLMADKFVNIDDLNIDLIDTVNPFQKAFEMLSRSVTKQVLRLIQDAIDASRIVIKRGGGPPALAENQCLRPQDGQVPGSQLR